MIGLTLVWEDLCLNDLHHLRQIGMRIRICILQWIVVARLHKIHILNMKMKSTLDSLSSVAKITLDADKLLHVPLREYFGSLAPHSAQHGAAPKEERQI